MFIPSSPVISYFMANRQDTMQFLLIPPGTGPPFRNRWPAGLTALFRERSRSCCRGYLETFLFTPQSGADFRRNQNRQWQYKRRIISVSQLARVRVLRTYSDILASLCKFDSATHEAIAR
jgi:hypothetical protein